MPEIRYNVITREWVVIATERAKRPDQFKRKDAKKELPPYNPQCPFCPGNEAMTPPPTFAIPDHANWKVRVTPNKFAALNYEGERVRTVKGIRRTVTGVGIHEVIVETRPHNVTMALLTDHDVELIVETYLDRFKSASSDPRIEQVTIFKNHGDAAGTSLEHPHSQLIATPIITSQLRERLSNAQAHYDEFAECIFCRVLELELQDAVRVFLETEHFVGLVPFAAYTPFSFMILPRRHMPTIAEMTDPEAADLARILRRALAKLYHGLSDPDFNYVVRTAPLELYGVKYYHWYVSVIPRLTKMAGFELGSGMFINVALPEENAAYLRDLKVD
jgi:UDPglucose--hexose-1-phosphate uridylyltransferase